jgi:phosphoribosylanthranilate isomerase
MNITLSGIDEKTDLKFLSSNFNYSSKVEFAILLSAKPDGRNRYPSLDWIREAIKTDLKFAVHLCGGDARKNALNGEYNDILKSKNVDRIQVNGKVSIEELKTFCNMLYNSIIITQDCPSNKELANIPYSPHMPNNRHILIDGSGGNGIVRENWDLPSHLSQCSLPIGFAGGLGPDNLSEILPKIKANKLYHSPWVDMETKLRDENDWFDISKALNCIYAAMAYDS